MGGAFFLIAGLFYLIRFLKNERLDDFSIAAFMAASGYLYRRPSAVLIFVIACVAIFFLCSKFFRERDKKTVIRPLLFMLMIALVTFLSVLPWSVVSQSIRPYHFYPVNFLDPKLLFSYAYNFPEMVLWPTTIFALLGLVLLPFTRKIGVAISALCFFFLYILFTGDDPAWVPIDRFSVLMVPMLTVLAVNTLSVVKNWHCRYYIMVMIGIISLLGLGSWVINKPFPGVLPQKANTLAVLPYYPVDELVKDLKAQGIPNGKLVFSGYIQPSTNFYFFMYGIHDYKHSIPKWSLKRNTTIADLKIKLKSKKDYKALVLLIDRNKEIRRIRNVVDLTEKQIVDNNVPGFKVLKIYYRNNLGLALLVVSEKKS